MSCRLNISREGQATVSVDDEIRFSISHVGRQWASPDNHRRPDSIKRVWPDDDTIEIEPRYERSEP